MTTQKAVPAGQSFYTGASFFWTPNSTSTSVTLTLSATFKNSVKDCGDIRTARASFFVRNGTTLTPINGAQNLPVGLVNAGDLSTGAAAINVQYPVGSMVTTLNIAVRITGNYTSDNDPATDVVVTIARPTPGGLIVGGGKMCNDGSAGFVKGAVGSVTDYSYSVQYNKSLTNPQGGVELTVRSYNDRTGKETPGILHVYKIKSNAISGFSVTSPRAEFNSKANITEIVNGVEQSIEGNCTLQMTMYDADAKNAQGVAGSLGSASTLSIIVYRNSGGVWYASNWDDVRNIQRERAVTDCDATSEVSVSGNAGNSSLAPSTITAPVTIMTAPVISEKTEDMLLVTAYPNPAITHFNIKVSSSNRRDAITVIVYNQMGQVVDVKRGLLAGQVFQVGSAYKQGTYFVEMIQGSKKQRLQMVKTN
jgi:hypothetical protein